MGKEIDFSNAVYPESQPMLEQSFEFMQNSAKERSADVAKASMQPYIANDMVILWGCVNSTPGTSTYTISEGAVFYNGEIYQVDAVTLTPVNAAVARFIVTQDPVDPILMKPSGASVDVHNITKVEIVDLVSGTGLKDFDDIKISNREIIKTNSSNGQTVTVELVSGGPFAYNSLVTKYKYRIQGGVCILDFLITFTVTTGAIVTGIRLPLPAGIVKATAANNDYAGIGSGVFSAPGGTTNYTPVYFNSQDDGTEGQRIVMRRSSDGDTNMTISTVATTIKGHVEIEL